MVTGKPRHSESNGGVERRNRTVENKISNWMQDNKSTHWAQALPFIQWRCNTQIHRGIGNCTPYHLMFGQHPHVGISNLPIDPKLLTNLATEVEVCQSLGLPDIPLEQVNLVNSLGINDSFPNLLSNLSPQARGTKADQAETTPPEADLSETTPPENETTVITKLSPFHSCGFKTDVTERIIQVMLQKAIVRPTVGPTYFGWKGVGFQVGVCFNKPPLLDLSFASRFLSMHQSMSEVPHHMRKSPPEWLLANHSATQPQDMSVAQNKDESISPDKQQDMPDQEDNMLFCKSCVVGPSKYETDCIHRWLFILLKCATPTDMETLQNAPLRSCFSIVDKESKLTDPWRRVILRKVRKSTWEVLDELGQSVLDTVPSSGDKGVLDQWGTWYKHPSVMDYKKAMLADEQRKSNMDEKEAMLRESPRRKHLRDLAYDSMTIQGRAMKKRAQAKRTVMNFDVGTIVQVPLHDVDTTKADGKNLTLVVVEVVQKKDKSCPMYRLACKAGVLDTLYHPSYITAVSTSSDVMGFENVCDQWTGLPRIKERTAAASVSMVGGQGKHLGCGCKSGTCRTGRCSCFKAGLKCNSKCHGGINKNCVNKD